MFFRRTLLLLACIALLPALSVHAENGISVKIQPSTIEEQVDPGDVLEGVLTITNENGGVQTYVIGTRDIVSMDENGRPAFAEVGTGDEMKAASWIKPLQKSVTMDVGESREVSYRIEVPAEASPGSYYAAIFVTREAENTNETGAGVGFNVASLVNLRVSGVVDDSIALREFYTDASLYTSQEVLFTTRIENNGTVHQRPQGVIAITDMLGNEVATVPVNQQAGGIMPRAEREYESPWSTDSFTLGRYTAVLSVVYGETGRRTLERTTTFWIVPIKEVGIFLGGIALLILGLIAALRAYVRRELRKAGHTAQKATQGATTHVTFARRMVRTLIRLLGVLVLIFIAVLVFFS